MTYITPKAQAMVHVHGDQAEIVAKVAAPPGYAGNQDVAVNIPGRYTTQTRIHLQSKGTDNGASVYGTSVASLSQLGVTGKQLVHATFGYGNRDDSHDGDRFLGLTQAGNPYTDHWYLP